jgi:excisionase family DNA binding protein
MSTTNDELLMSTDEVARYLGVPAATVTHWRRIDRGPRYTHAGRVVRYRRSDVDAWLDERTVEPAR